MDQLDRRAAFRLGALSVGAFAAACAHPRDAHEEGEGGEDVGPAEDLMREHGALNRILLVYEEGARRIEAGDVASAAPALARAASIIETFVEGYHEKLEEDHLFPRFEAAKKLADLVAILRDQHKAGRALTAQIRALTAGSPDADRGKALLVPLRAFVRMYRPHEAREDTVLFPAIRSIVPAKEYAELGEQFEDEEHRRFGAEGFEGVVREVAAIEETLGIGDLSRFTP